MGKIKSLKEVKRIARRLKAKGKRIVFTNGCFDILHYGHLKYLQKCKKLGDVLIIGLNSDSSVKRLKGKKRPLAGEKERASILAALEFVNYVVPFKEDTPLRLIKEISPNVLAKGGDWKKKDIVGSEHVLEKGGKVASVSFVKGYSTTDLIHRIKHG